ncbi:hypothetical protein PAPYR_12697 [Paratrimastix pyriformis]|uniref:Uncharacterized protein n=1 Tax=Paratrimastix pyriformis TaxID=342808 RepID=A0ABQ8U511_9EUKA|nr:hypothetical protein PAPYR_12697 [Paratrimastix pyriformis]
MSFCLLLLFLTCQLDNSNSATTATDASSASTIVLRNASGDTKVNNLSANTVLANSVKSVTSGNLDIQSNGNVNIDIDNDNNETGKTSL